MSHKRIALFSGIILVAGIIAVWQLWTNIPDAQQHQSKERTIQNSSSVAYSFENNRVAKADTEPQAPRIMPEYFQTALLNKKHNPKLGDMPPVEPWVKQELINRYKSLGSLTNKMQITRLLTYIGGEDVVQLFANTITNEYKYVTLSHEEGMRLKAFTGYLGMLSGKSDTAYQFLKNASTDEFWKYRFLGSFNHMDTSKMEDTLLVFNNYNKSINI